MTKAAKHLAWALTVLGVFNIALGLVIGFEALPLETADQEPVFVRGAGGMIDTGAKLLLAGIVLGVLADISRKLDKLGGTSQ